MKRKSKGRTTADPFVGEDGDRGKRGGGGE
jgi:hypothetical protein